MYILLLILCLYLNVYIYACLCLLRAILSGFMALLVMCFLIKSFIHSFLSQKTTCVSHRRPSTWPDTTAIEGCRESERLFIVYILFRSVRA